MNRALALVLVLACGGDALLPTPDAAVEASAEAGSPCATNEVLCGGTCYSNDVAHCGTSCAMCPTPAHGQATCDGHQCGVECADTFTACGGACVDATTDAHNCGACGRDCFGSACESDMCQPYPLYLVTPNALAVDSTNLYWISGGSIVEAAKVGAGTPKSLAACTTCTGAIAVDDANVYALASTTPTAHPTLVYVPLTGATTSYAITAPAAGSIWTNQLRVSPQGFYLAQFDGDATQIAVNVITPDGGSGATLATVPQLSWFDVLGTTPYVAWQDDAGAYFGPGSPDGGSVLVTTTAGTIRQFVLLPGEAYLGAAQAVIRAPLDGGASSVAFATGNLTFMVTDGKSVYWVENQAPLTAIYRTAIDSTTRTLLLPPMPYGMGYISALAVDDTFIYFVLSSEAVAGVCRLPK